MTGIYANKHFLVIEDDEITATSLSALLTKYGAASVRMVHSGKSALALLKTEKDGDPFDAAIVDIDLGDGDCSAVTLALSEEHIPFVFHSGRSSDYPHVLQEYPVPFVAKPSTDFDMIFALEKVMGWPDRTPPKAA